MADVANTVIAPDGAGIRIRVRDVQVATARVMGVPVQALRQSYGPHVNERQLAMMLSAELTGKGKPDIAVHFACTHATIIHAVAKVRKRLRLDRDLRLKVDRICVEATIEASRFIESMRRAALPQANTGRSA